MANLIDLLKGVKNKIGSNNVTEFAPLVKVEGADDRGLMPDGSFAQTQPLQLEHLQVDNNGQLVPNAQFHPMNTTQPVTNNGLFSKIANKTVDAVFGKQAPATDNVNAESMEVTVSDNPRVGGLINDISGGYRENRNNAFNLKNWGDNDLGNNREKGFAYRLGEGLGSTARGLKRAGGALGRFADTPLGRAAIMAGIVGATGGSGLQALAYGGTAGLGNQVNRMNDNLYRRDLKAQGIDTSNIKGYITKDTYQNLINSRIAQENAAYRRMYYDNQNINQQELMEFRRREAERQARQDERDYYLDSQRVAQGWANIENDRKKANQLKPIGDSQVKDLKGTTDFINSLNNISTRYSDPKYDKMFGLKGDIRRNNPFSRYDAEASLFKQDVEILRQRYAKLLEGGRLSDSDRAFYQKALFNPNVSRKDFLEAVRRMRATLEQDYENALNMYEKQGKDVSDFRMYSQPQRANNTGITKSGIKYEVIE